MNHNRRVPPVTIEALNNERRFDDRRYLNPELRDMFLALNLIESYGSGIRRAKDALEENHSPKLKFLPDNDTDDYTMAILYINAEFAKIRDEENKKSTSLSTPSTSIKQNELQNRILHIIRENPHVTKKQMIQELGITMYELKK